jgi:CBS domain-containing protein
LFETGTSKPRRVDMLCSELMKKDVACSNAKSSARQVAELMRDRNVGFVPICDDKGAVIGTITDRDLTVRVLASKKDPESTKASDVMSTGVITCKQEETLADVEQLMSKHKVSRIVVVDEQSAPIGVISLSDVATVETGGKSSAVLRSVSQREARP